MGWVRVCSAAELPRPGEMLERSAGSKQLCIANNGGVFAAIDNICPHRGGPLAEGLLENGKVLCPWHAWAFDLKTGLAEHDARERVSVYPIRIEEDTVTADI